VEFTVPGIVHGVVGGAALVVVIVLAVGQIPLALAALFSVLVSGQGVGMKLLWILLILAVPVLGGIGWFLVGRERYGNRTSSTT
jgi:hypothetical protein